MKKKVYSGTVNEIFYDLTGDLDKDRRLSDWEIDEIYFLIETLVEHFKDKDKATEWFFRPNHFLDNEAPTKLIIKGKLYMVCRFAKSFFKSS